MDEKAPINWTNMLIFTITPLLALTLVPVYGYLYGYDSLEWIIFTLLFVYSGCLLYTSPSPRDRG